MAVDYVGITFTAISLAITAIYSYYAYFAIIGFMKNSASPAVLPKNRFAIIVAAYHEDKVIRETIRNLTVLDYPRELYDIYVIVDDRDDGSGIAAAEEGATVLVRSNPERPGLGHVLKWGLPEIRKLKPHDAFIVLAADNMLSQNYLSRMNDELVAGHKLVQGNLRSKNPKDSWISKSIHAEYVMRNRFQKQPRQDHRLCVFMEPGACVSSAIIDEFGWNATSITEDLEFTCQIAEKGYTFKWAYDANVYEEKPTSLRVAIRQRTRWMCGHAVSLTKHTRKLLSEGVRKRNTVALDCALYLLFPIFMMVWFFGQIACMLSASTFTLLAFIPRDTIDSKYFWIFNVIISFWWFVLPLYALHLEKERVRDYWFTPIAIFLFTIIQIFLLMYGLVKRDRHAWWHTPHSSSLRIEIPGAKKAEALIGITKSEPAELFGEVGK